MKWDVNSFLDKDDFEKKMKNCLCDKCGVKHSNEKFIELQNIQESKVLERYKY